MGNNVDESIYKGSMEAIQQLFDNQEGNRPSSEVLSELGQIDRAHKLFIEEYVNSIEADIDVSRLEEATKHTEQVLFELINEEVENLTNVPHQQILDLLAHAINNGGLEVHKNYRDLVIRATEKATPEQLHRLNGNTGLAVMSGVICFRIDFSVGAMTLSIFTEDLMGKFDKYGTELRSAIIVRLIRDFEELYGGTGIDIKPVLVGHKSIYNTVLEFNGKNWDTNNFMTNGEVLHPAVPLNQENVGIFTVLKQMEESNHTLAKINNSDK